MDPDLKPKWLITAFTQDRLWTIVFISMKKFLLVNVIVLSASLTGVHSNRGDRSDDDEDDDEESWYQLWYFWLIVSLFLVGVLLLVFIYCKQQAKQARLEGMGRFRAQMVLPPAYDEPVQPPPPYSVAAAASATDRVQPAAAYLRHQYQPNPFGYLPQNVTILSSSTTRAESAPPPYSPPPYSAQENPHNAQGRTSPADDVTTLRSGSSTPGPSSRHSATASIDNTTQHLHFTRTSGSQRGPTSFNSSTLETMQLSGYQGRAQERNSTAHSTFYHNPVPTVNNLSPCSNDGPIYSISQSQLSINLRRSDGGTNPQPYDLSVNEIRAHDDHGRTSRPTMPSSNQIHSPGISSTSRQLSNRPDLCVTNLSETFQSERLSLGASASRDSSRLVTAMSYNLSDSTPGSANSHRLYGRNAHASGKIHNKPATSVPMNRSGTSIASSSNSASVFNASGSSLSNRPLSRQINNSQHSRLSQALTSPK